MKSKERSEPLNLDRGLPTTPTDVEALQRIRSFRMSDDEYLAFLAQLPPSSANDLRKRGNTEGDPFTLDEET